MDKLIHMLDALDHDALILWGSALVLGIFVLFLRRTLIHSTKHSSIEWYDLITDQSDHISLTKVLNLTGGVIGSWVIVKLTLQDKITWDLFTIYLFYCASIDGFSKDISAKYKK